MIRTELTENKEERKNDKGDDFSRLNDKKTIIELWIKNISLGNRSSWFDFESLNIKQCQRIMSETEVPQAGN